MWGLATDALTGASVAVWDNANSVNVSVRGTLTSSTIADIDANPAINLAMLGQEMFNFATAYLEADGSYTLSGLKRGRRGTEWAVSDHAIGDLFVLTASLERDERGLSDIAETITFKAQTAGRTLDGQPTIPITLEGASIKPYAPAAFKGALNGNDWVFTWVRRTRVGGNWNGSTIPVSEVSELYHVKIYDGDDVIRTITATTPTATYTAAQQTTDFGSNQTSISATVQQIGDAVDGYPSEFVTAPAPSIRAFTGLAVSQPVALPSYEPGDVLLAICECTNAVISPPTGWESAPSSPKADPGVSRLSVFWKYAGVSEADPNISANGDDHLFTRIVSIKDAQIIGSPFDASSGDDQETTPTYTIPGLTTNVNNCLILDIASTSTDSNATPVFSGWTNASLTSFAEVFDLTENDGGGGGIGMAAGVKGTAGAVSSTTVTTGESGAVIKLALRPR